MIKKIIKIKNIGQFKDFKASGDVTFDKVTLIYGENSAGKTTLVSILRSLIKNDPSIIIERKSFGLTEDQIVEMLVKDNKIDFVNSKWKRLEENFKNLEIYDEFFVNENVFTGLEIHPEHQKNLCGFVLGEGVFLAKEIERIKEDLNQKKYPERNKLKSQIEFLVEGQYSVESFIDLAKDERINEKIKEKKEELNIAKKVEEISQTELLKEIHDFRLLINFDELKKLICKSLESISDDALEKIKQHIESLNRVLKKDSESWLYQGVNYVEAKKDNICPFCQQNLKESKKLIKVYQQYFSEAYRELKRAIDGQMQQIDIINIEQLMDEREKSVLNNNTLCEFWKNFIPDIEVPELERFEQFKEEIIKLFNSVKKLIEKKSENITQSIDIKEINSLIKSIEKIKRLKNQQQTDIPKLTDDLKKLEIYQKRYSIDVGKLCEKYKQCEEDILDLNKKKNKKTEKLNIGMYQKIDKYIVETNKFLEKFGVNFRIINPKTRYRGRGEEPYLEYFLEMEGFSIDPLQQTKFTLSGGDKNALALSFSLAKFNVDKNNGFSYDKKIKDAKDQKRYWYFREISKKDIKTKKGIHINHGGCIFAGDLYNIGLGKIIALRYQNPLTKKDEIRLGVLADSGGALTNNLYQLDLFAGIFKNRIQFHDWIKQLPNAVEAYILIKV